MLERLARFLSRSSAPPVPAAAPALTPPSSAEECKRRGNAHLAKGELDAAADCYQQAIAIDPAYAEAYNNLGYVYLQQGRDNEAERHLHGAISLNPGLANAHYNLGTLYQKDGRNEQAVVCYEKALALAPDNGETLHSLGELFYRLGRKDDALACLRRVIRQSPDAFLAHYNLALLLHEIGEPQEAITCLNRTLALAPDFVEAYCELGKLFREQKQLDAAALYYEKAIALRPDEARTHRELGLVMLMQEKQREAAACFVRAIDIEPTLADAHMSLAETLQKLGQLDEALASVERAITLAPHVAESHVVKGLVFKDQGRYEEAERCLRHALTLKPEDEAIRFAMSTVLLAHNQFAEGWELYGRRFHYGDLTARRDFGHPEWAGENLQDKAIVVWRDQGIGDEILFASLLPDIISRAQRCVVECANKLVPLFTLSFPDAVVVPKMEPPHPATRDGIDFQIAMADAARWLRPDFASFPAHDRYLTADAARVDHWKAKLATLGPGLKIGFAWRSSLVYGQRSLHYTDLDQWGPIFSLPGVHFISLQYDGCADELAAARRRFGIPLHAFDEVDLFNDLAEAAALKQALDLVISAPTATAFLAAALGVPTWMMSYATPWQMMGTDRVPWFPAMRCFPRRWNQNWEEIIGDIAARLRAAVAQHTI